MARIWDAINDPLMGYFADRNESKRGKFRPFLLYGALPLNLVLIACFFTPELSETGRIIYAYVTYILHGMLFTLVGLPYSALTAVMTQDQQERAVISTYRMFFAVAIAVTLVAVGVRPFVALFATLMLGWTGYVANVEQTEKALGGISALFNLVPAGFSILCLLTLLFYPITAALFQRITGELAERDVASTELA